MKRELIEPVELIQKLECPKCNNTTLELHPGAVMCSHCAFELEREVTIDGSTNVLSSVQCAELLLRFWNVGMVGDYYGRLTFVDGPKIDIYKGLKCPECGGRLLDYDIFVKCENQIFNSKKYKKSKKSVSGCKFLVWRVGLSSLGHLTLSDDELRVLISGRCLWLDLVGSKGRWGKFAVSLRQQTNGYWELKPDIHDECWPPLPEPKHFL